MKTITKITIILVPIIILSVVAVVVPIVVLNRDSGPNFLDDSISVVLTNQVSLDLIDDRIGGGRSIYDSKFPRAGFVCSCS